MDIGERAIKIVEASQQSPAALEDAINEMPTVAARNVANYFGMLAAAIPNVVASGEGRGLMDKLFEVALDMLRKAENGEVSALRQQFDALPHEQREYLANLFYEVWYAADVD